MVGQGGLEVRRRQRTSHCEQRQLLKKPLRCVKEQFLVMAHFPASLSYHPKAHPGFSLEQFSRAVLSETQLRSQRTDGTISAASRPPHRRANLQCRSIKTTALETESTLP